MIGRPLGLRTTLTVLFAVGGTLLAATMAMGTFWVARSYLIDQREHTAVRQAFSDASFVRDGLLTSGSKVSDVLGSVSPPAQSTVLVHHRGRWYSSSLDLANSAVPDGLSQRVGRGEPAFVWTRTRGLPGVMVGVPLPAVDAQFYEVTATVELDRTLNTLRWVLSAFAVAVTVLAALLGRWAARRVVAPLDEVAGAAARIAGGELDTRLASTEDPDLATIVGSFNSMVDALHERIERDARFAADVSHELRSPLTALVTSVDVLDRRRGELSDGSAQLLDLVKADLARFHTVLEDLLELGRLEAGAASRVTVPVDVRDLVRHVLLDSGRSERLLRTPPIATVVDVDKQQMARALRNLFDNADLHGRGLTGVTVSLEETGESDAHGDVLVSIEDRGPGVAPGEAERIFARFARGGSRGSLRGAGLGLSLVAETVRAHGGTVWCSGNSPRGACFVIRLPAAAAEGGAS